MARNMRSAKNAGTAMETMVAHYMAEQLEDDNICRQTKTGAKDLGDIRGVKIHGQRVAVEVKNTAKHNLAGWAAEAEVERGNLDALAGVVVHKRHGKGQPGDQWVTLTLRDFVALLSGVRDPE